MFLLCKSLLFFLFFSFSNCQESSLDWEKKMTNTKRDSSSLNILRKSFLSFQIKLGMKGNKKRKELKLLGCCCSTWSCFLIHAQCVLFLSNNSIYFAFKMGIEKWHFFLKGINFCQLMKNGSGKRISRSSPIFRRGNKCEFISRPSITNGNSIPGSKSNIDGTLKIFPALVMRRNFPRKTSAFFTLPSSGAIFKKVANDMTCTRCHILNMDVSACWTKKVLKMYRFQILQNSKNGKA